VILSFLKCELERTVIVILQTFQTAQSPSPFTVHELPEVFSAVLVLKRLKTVEKAHETFMQTVMNDNGCNAERKRSSRDALTHLNEWFTENVYVHVHA
jgi:hypothetical protein